jgi:hypothetical protein
MQKDIMEDIWVKNRDKNHQRADQSKKKKRLDLKPPIETK